MPKIIIPNPEFEISRENLNQCLTNDLNSTKANINKFLCFSTIINKNEIKVTNPDNELVAKIYFEQ